MGLGVQADPEPLRNRFIRSDQYSFIRQGVPALALKVGYAPDSPEAAMHAAWTKDRYHAPSDDLQQPVDKRGRGRLQRSAGAADDGRGQSAAAAPLERQQLLQALRARSSGPALDARVGRSCSSLILSGKRAAC